MALRDVAIVGVYATDQRRMFPDRGGLELAQEAVFGAIADAGLTPADIDGVAADWPGPGGHPGEPASWARVLGHPLRWINDGMLDAAGSRGILKAAAAIDAGLCHTAVVGGGMAGMFRGGSVGGSLQAIEFTDVWGAYVVPLFALVATSHMHEFGTTAEQVATAAATIRNNGHVNPEAVMYGKGPYTVEDILASPMIASPLHRLEICLAGEGGAAVVLTTVERARDLPHIPVRVLGGAMEFSGAPYVSPPQYREVGRLGADSATRALAMAGVGVADIDVFNLYDPNSFEIIRQVEALGLCAEGEGGPFVADGNIALDGAHPVNPDGGCLSYAWNGTQQMTLKAVECVRQIRGTAVNQLANVEVAIAANAGSAAGHYEIAVLGV
ncbi:thiolase family protein [Mycobacterium sp. M26]|uniref:thiolase family protein n=1 Tax=Mycobacterium sp. M26 TaxID=1762962 RepID=UPI00073E5AB8|nr:thiolase family protein [Mycobacterium sp. M26]